MERAGRDPRLRRSPLASLRLDLGGVKLKSARSVARQGLSCLAQHSSQLNLTAETTVEGHPNWSAAPSTRSGLPGLIYILLMQFTDDGPGLLRLGGSTGPRLTLTARHGERQFDVRWRKPTSHHRSLRAMRILALRKASAAHAIMLEI